MKRFLLFFSLIILFLLNSCANHPSITPGKLDPGESNYSYSFSMENVVPVYNYQYGLSKSFDVNASIGLPIWGSGLTLSYLIKSDSLKNVKRFTKFNFGYLYQHNSAYEISYLKERFNATNSRLFYYGARTNYIPDGLSGDTAFRLGFFGGYVFKQRFGLELGYTHDFELETNKLDPVTGWPTEHHLLTGLSIKLIVGGFHKGLE